MLKRKKHFKITGLLVLVALLMQILPFQVVFHSGGIGIERSHNKVYAIDKEIEYDAITDSEADEAVDQIVYGLGKPILNSKRQQLNGRIYIMYGIIAYGEPSFSPSSNVKTPSEYPDLLDRTEYRYLGYAEDGTRITNDDFPDDATGDIELPDKNWIYSNEDQGSWNKLDNLTPTEENALIHYILFEADLKDDGEPISLKANEILGTSDIDELKKYITLQTYPTIRGNGSLKIIHETSKGEYYDTFTTNSFDDKIDLTCQIETDDTDYMILPNEDYVDVVIDVTAEEDLGSFPSTYITKRSVEYDGKTKDGYYGQYTERIYKRDLNEGENKIDITGYAEFTSIFPTDGDNGSDGVIRKTDTEQITVTVVKDELYVRLGLPATAGINENYLIEDLTHYPEGEQVKSSKLYKKASGSWALIQTWGKLSESMTDSHPVKATIDYKLVIELENGETGEDTKTIEIIDDRSVNATADLELDTYTYEGHPAYARDVSYFDVEGETYSASRAYEENLAHNDFEVVENTPHDLDRLSDTKAKLIFDESGYYNVRLEVETQDDKELYDIEPIEVRETPYINDYLGGVQKENRKQILNISVAKHPDYPITDIWVEIKDTQTGESVHLTSLKQNSSNIKTRDITASETEGFNNYTLEFLTKNNTEKIYQYTIYAKDAKGDTDTVSKDFTVYPDDPPIAQINIPDFFLRNEDSNIADITVEDGTISSDGDQVQRTWKVKTNSIYTLDNGLHPHTGVEQQGSSAIYTGAGQLVFGPYIPLDAGTYTIKVSGEGLNNGYARAYGDHGSQSWTSSIHYIERTNDYVEYTVNILADAERAEFLWVANNSNYMRLDGISVSGTYKSIDEIGYTDLSFGSMKKIQFPKTGVGKADIRLDVKEVWTEPTLEEYVTEADHLTGYTTAETEVKNVAPMVSVEPINTYMEDVFMLSTKNNQDALEAQKNTLNSYLKSNAIDSQFTVSLFENPSASDEYLWKKSIDTPSLNSGIDNGEVYTMDNNNFYRVKASTVTQNGDGDFEANPPFTIQALDNETGNVKWSSTLSNEYYNARFDLKNDDLNKYLYVVPPKYYGLQKITIIDKKTGAFITEYPCDYEDINGDFYLKEDALYVFGDDGINKLNLSTGDMTRIEDYSIHKSKKVKGKVHFGFAKGNVNYRGIFDLNTRDLTKQPLVSVGAELGFNTYNTIAMDIYGKMVLKGNDQFLIYDCNNICIKKIDIPYHRNGWDKEGVVTDLNSEITHVYCFEQHSDDGDMQEYFFVAEINGDRSQQYHYEDTANITVGNIVFKKSVGDDIYFVKSGHRGHYTCASNNYKVDLDSSACNRGKLGNDGNIGEYGISSDNYFAFVVIDDDDNVLGTQEVYMNKYPSTLEQNINRSINKDVYFRKGYQKNIVILDTEHDTNTNLMSKVINTLDKMGTKFTSIGNSITGSHYLLKIKDALNGNAIKYSSYNMENNLLNLGNVININKETPKNPVVNVNGNGASSADIYKSIVLEAGQEYCYEYDIKYNNKGSMTNADIFNVNHIINDTIYNNGSNKVMVPVKASEEEYFIESGKRNSFFNFSGEWEIDDHDNRLQARYDGDLDWDETTNLDETITFTTDETSVLSFCYGYDAYYRIYRDHEYASYLKIVLDDVEMHVEGSLDSGDKVVFSRQIPPGKHKLELRYHLYNDDDDEAYISDLKVIYPSRRTNGSMDNGVFTQENVDIKEGEWQHVSNTFKTPVEDSQYVKRYNGSYVVENFSDTHYNFSFSGTYRAINGMYRPASDRGDSDGNDDNRYGILTFAVPNGKKGILEFDAKMYITYIRDSSYIDNVYGLIDDGINYNRMNVYRTGGYSYISPTREFRRVYSAGTYSIKFQSESYYKGNKERWYCCGFMGIDNLSLKLEPNMGYDSDIDFIDHIDSDYGIYKKSKVYTGESSVKLSYSSTIDSDFLIRNFRLYEVRNGEKVLKYIFDTLSQDQLESVFSISKSNAQVNVINEPISEEDEEAPLIYKKGQLVLYNVYYDDYENDPSKKQYWQYTHTPFNDGPHPEAGEILNKPIERFYIDGKYTVKHWQEDNTGVSAYDKESNVEEITFYVQGNAVAPEITYIKTLPNEVKEGDTYKIEIGIWDEDLDVLDTTIELYKNNTLIYTYTQDDVTPTDGEYPPIISDHAPKAAVGKYTIVAIASDDTGTGIDSNDFTVISEGNVEGLVMHTDKWNENRKKYNLSKSGNEDEPRGYHVFWSGEKFVLHADTEGDSIGVNVEILDEGYSTSLSSSEANKWIGSLWDETMINKWGKEAPETLVFRFTAYYSTGLTKINDVSIIVDDRDSYWQYHQAW